MTTPGIASSAEGTARKAADSRTLEVGARVGLVARGVVYILIGVLAAQIALGDSAQADQNGALDKIAEQPFGKSILWLVAAGFVAYGLWRLGEAAWGRQEETDDKKRTIKRIESVASGLLYLVLCVTAVRLAQGAADSGQQKDLTARLLDAPGGRSIFLITGAVIVGVGIALAWRGLKTDFEKQLNRGEMSSQTYTVVRRLGRAGYLARGAVFGLVGLLVITAAREHDPDKAAGLDVALHSVARAPYGTALLLAAAAGLMCFGAYSIAESRYRRL